MGKIDNSMIKENIKNVFDGLKDVVTAYAAYSNKMKELSGDMYSVEHVERKESEYAEDLKVAALKVRTSAMDSLEKMQNSIIENNKIFDFSDPELSNCITLLKAAGNNVPFETVEGIANRFMGNRQALVVLRELVPEWYKETFSDGIFDVESEVDALADVIWRITENPKDNVFHIISLKQKLKEFAKRNGIELSEYEMDLGTDYHKLVVMQTYTMAGVHYTE